LRRSAHLALEETTNSLARLAEIAAHGRGMVVVARIQDSNAELAEVVSLCEAVPIVVLVANAQKVAPQALQAGADAVLDRAASGEQIAAAVTSACHGLVTIPAGVARFGESATLGAPPEPLTPREREILSLLAAGDSNRTIATRLSISVHTVKFHLSSIFSKLGVTSRTEAVALGLKLGIVLL